MTLRYVSRGHQITGKMYCRSAVLIDQTFYRPIEADSKNIFLSESFVLTLSGCLREDGRGKGVVFIADGPLSVFPPPRSAVSHFGGAE